MQQNVRVSQDHLREVYAKVKAFDDAQDKIEDDLTRENYFNWLFPTEEDKAEAVEAFECTEDERCYKFSPALVGLYIVETAKDMAELFKRAFALMLENMQTPSKPKQEKNTAQNLQDIREHDYALGASNSNDFVRVPKTKTQVEPERLVERYQSEQNKTNNNRNNVNNIKLFPARESWEYQRRASLERAAVRERNQMQLGSPSFKIQNEKQMEPVMGMF